MKKRIISAVMIFALLCVSLAGCGCQATTIDSDEVAEVRINDLMNEFTDALNNSDRNAYNKLTTGHMRASDNDINKYFDNITEFILMEIAFDSKQQTGATYEMLIHYYVTFDRSYTGTQYKIGISNMTDRFVIVKEGDTYKLDAINKFGS